MSEVGTPLVSFVLPCYNYGRFLGDCLDSIFGLQGNHHIEVVVVDDASTDDTLSVARGYADDRIHLIAHETNRGHADTVNNGLSAARGRFVARMDPDDRYRPQFLNAVLPVFEAYPDVGLVYGDAAMIDESGRETAATTDTEHGGRDFFGNEYIRLLQRNFICAPTVIARREAWAGALPVPSHLAFHDWYFTLMMARHYKFAFLTQVLADYRVHSQNMHTAIARNRTEEASVFWVLDYLYGQVEESPLLQAEKVRARRRVYAAHYLDAANKYFFFGMTADARRCYLRAMRLQPQFLRDPGNTRHVLATLMGRERYEWAKAHSGRTRGQA